VVSSEAYADIGRTILGGLPLIWITDFTARLSAAADSHVSELSAQLALFRKRLVDASQFIPSYDQRQYEMVSISLDALDVIIDTI
jgi:hypothetical protein